MTALNRDCLWEIFTNLEHDKKTLHGALLVNRLWCEIAVQFLWRKPFRFLYTCSKFCRCSEQRRQVKVKNLLASLTTILAHKHTSSSVNIQDLVILTTAPLTTFIYTDFIRHLDIHDLVWTLYDGVEYLRSQRFIIPFVSDIAWSNSTITRTDSLFQKIACNLCRLLMLYCSNLSHLSIDMVNTKWSEDNQRCTSLPSVSF